MAWDAGAPTGSARETQEMPALDRHQPPKATPPIQEGLRRTADTGATQAHRVGPPRPPEIRTSRRGDPASGERATAAPDWTAPVSPPPVPSKDPKDLAWGEAGVAPTASPPSNAIYAGEPEVTEHDIARVARTTSTRTVKVGGVDVTFGSQRSLAAVGAVAMALLVGLLALAVSGLGRDDNSAAAGDGSREAAVFDDDQNGGLLVSGQAPAAPNISQLAQSTVQVVGFDESNNEVCFGSGVIVGAEGLVLTNAHVVNGGADCDIASIGIAVTEDISTPPEPLYEAVTVVADTVSDLAVAQIIGRLSSAPNAQYPRSFPAAVLGDSDAVELGDSIRILGYPVIGGETITSTTGSVSGFSPQEGLGGRALIKTDAAISAGNSGGMAINGSGEVIGIPTRAQATESGPAVDCRPIQDTNRDGEINSDDNCSPVGGFLNGIRPINLATALLAEAEAVLADPNNDLQREESNFDLSGVVLTNPRFSLGEINDEPAEEVLAVPAGSTEICLFVDWTGIPIGVPWDAVGLVDGEQVAEFARLDYVWSFEEEGWNFWYCARDDDGHKPGILEMGLFLDGQLMFVEGVRIYEDQLNAYEVTWVNRTEQDICGLAFNPKTDSRHVGLNELEIDTVIGVGEQFTMELPEGDIVVEAYDCSGRAVAAELDGLNIPDDLTVDGDEVPLVIGIPLRSDG